MTTAVDTRISADSPAAAGPRAPKVGPRRRLFTKYAFALVGLVSLVLMANGLLNVWFSYNEAKDAAIRLQREKADAAAQHIEEFIAEIEKQIGWTTATQWASSPIDQRRFDYGRLQRQVPAITELIQLDGQGHEQLKVSRLAMDVVGSGADYSADPRFKEALAKKVWFGPVYFRKESEPYMTMAVAQSGRNAGVTAAEVNLKLIWDVITAIKIGKSGYAYVIDGDGRLIAHPDISRVLRNTDLSALPQVAAARGPAGTGAEPAAIVHNLDGHRVLSASAPIPKLGWLVFVEQPITEALAPLYTTLLNTGLLLLLGLAVAILAGLLLARRMTGPIRALDAGAARIGAGVLEHRIAVHTGDELEELAERFNTMAADLQSSYADLEKKVEDRTAELTEALDQQTATAEVLGVINSSPGDLAPVFDAILEKAHTLCAADHGNLTIYDGDHFRSVANNKMPESFAELLRQPFKPYPGGPQERLLRGERLIHIPDQAAREPTNPMTRAAVEAGVRTLLFVPLRKDDALLGYITAHRKEVRPFTDKQIALLQNFAAQAVIAMENARLITETREALEQQTATAEVLGVINSSPGNLAPVFDAMLEKAHSLCEAAFGVLWTYDGEAFRTGALHSVPQPYADFVSRDPWRPNRGGGNGLARIADGADVAHFADVAAEPAFQDSAGSRAVVELGGARSMVVVALRRDAALLGAITAYRQEVRPFSERQIALLQNFAAQAVIAMENARLITETREALEQQTATAEVLGVINSSPGDLAPVFDAILEKAHTLCGASKGSLVTVDGEHFRTVARRGLSEPYAAVLREAQHNLPGSAPDRLLKGEKLVHIPDVRESEFAIPRAAAELEGARTIVYIPLRKDSALLGYITAYRQEVRPFSEKQIALLQNFAAQAVIAMENARLITETQEALEQQTATAEVLGVINSSPGDLAPVFDAMLEKAIYLCQASFGTLWTYDGEGMQAAAVRDAPREYTEFVKQRRFPVNAVVQRLLQGEPAIQIADLTATEGYGLGDPAARALVERAGNRTLLAVALRKEDAFLGMFAVYRREVRPFSEKQIALLQNFAAQAVIAMENARLITETREALEQQTATAEVLGVINSSPGDLAPVFESMLEKATRLCEAPFGILRTWDGERFHFGAVHGDPQFCDWVRQRGPIRPDRDASLLGRIQEGERVVCLADAQDDEGYRASSGFREMAEASGIRSAVTVALHKDDALLGIITVYRQEVRPFSDKQIALLQNFAAQAVIAMENARLINETREALEQQTATAEVLGVINSSPSDLTPVFSAILEKAHGLCGVTFGTLQLYDGEKLRAVATRGFPEPLEKVIREPYAPEPNSPLLVLINGGRFVQIRDLAEHDTQIPNPRSRIAVDLGIRALLFLPLRKDNLLLGLISAARTEGKLFSEREIALLENFAAQAVIAMENARLITETREALEQQTATAEVLGVINSSPGDLAPVFDTMLDKALQLCGAAFGVLWTYDGTAMSAAASRNAPPKYAEFLASGPYRPGKVTAHGRLIRGSRFEHIPDVAASEDYRHGDPFPRALVDLGKGRTILAVPLRKDDVFLGDIFIYRQEVRPFTDKQITLLENFAAQAVIAMENARLITETRERTHDLQESLEYQTATSEVLKVISQSGADLEPVLEMLVETAARLCDAEQGYVFRLRENRHYLAASFGLEPEFKDFMLRNPFGVDRGTLSGRTLLERRVVHIEDAANDPEYTWTEAQQRGKLHTGLGVPLLREDTLIGVLGFFRSRVEPFTEKQIALVTTFADQAVIAIENARLLGDLQGRTHDLQESLEYQTATSDVLKVISRSGAELEPVLHALVETAARICQADKAMIMRLQDGFYRMAASFGYAPEFVELMARNRLVPGTGTVTGQTALERRVVHIQDTADNPDCRPEPLHAGEHRTALGVPLFRDESVVGVIFLARAHVEPFTEPQIELVRTFADQAVIAIENARLLGDLQGRTHDLQESLEYQTATSDVLQVISQSGAELEPMLQTLVETAARICDADKAVLQQLRDGLFRIAASFGFPQEWKDYRARNPIAPDRGTPIGRMALERRVVHVEDALTDPEYTELESRRLGEFRTMLAVPLFREGAVIGGLFLARSRVERFTEKQIALVTTFADQAVIAIENARLFNELRARTTELGSSVAELKMLNEVAQAVSSTLDLRSVLSTILTSSLGMTWANAGAVFRYSRPERAFRLVEAVGWDEALMRSVRDLRLAESETAMGEAVARRMPVQLVNTEQRASNPLRDLTLAAGYHSALIVPLLGAERIFGAIILLRQEAGEFPAETVRLMQTLASQSVLAIQNARLFREIADKSEQLALASQHKSQFLANMSHELRTPLNAILGYAELLVDGIYGVLPDRPKGVLERIQNNGKHLLALINDVLDLAKIEAGQLTLTLEDYTLPEVVRSVVTATEPLATSKGLNFTATLQEDMPKGHGDARRLSQVLLNLVGNAIKFTEAGEIEISASSANGQFVLNVRDTGPGIADADQERIFGEFQQIDNSNTRNKGGTGLGLAISKRMVEMQGGTIAVESVLGQGSTFRVVLPVHVDEMMEAAE